MAGIVFTWKPRGLLNLEALIRQELQAGIERMGQDLATPKGTGLGAQVNSLSVRVGSGLATVESSLVWPRTTGESWLARSLSEGEDLAETVLEEVEAAIVEGVGE